MENPYNITNRQLEEIRELAKKVQESIVSVPKETLEQISIVRNLLSSFPPDYFKKITDEYTRVAQTFKDITFSQISTAINVLQNSFIKQSLETAKTFKKIDDTIRAASKILFDLGWWIQPEWSLPSLGEIVKAHKEGKDNEIEQEIIAYFNDSKLDDIISSWKLNKKLAQRMSILEDAVWAHKQGKYTLSIPTLLPQVEGIINENSGRTGRIRFSECVTIFNDRLSKNSSFKTTSSLYPLALLKFVENLLKEDFEWGKPSKKGRHPILHGHNVSYSDRVFSLKLILLVDFIQNLI